MRLNSKINDSTDLVNKAYVEKLLAELDDTTIAALQTAIENLEDNTQWGEIPEENEPIEE